MRRYLTLVTLLLAPGSLHGQHEWRGWSITVGADHVRFSRGVRDTAGPVEHPVSLRPSGRTGAHVSLERGFGAWRVQIEAGWAEGSAEVANESIVVRDQTLDLSRYRLAPAVELRAAELGPGELAVALAPTLDLWRAAGDSRLRLGLEGRLAARVPLGGVVLENRLALGFSGAPFNREDLGNGFELRGLRSLSLGVGLGFPL